MMPNPTHDQARDIGRASVGRSNYNLMSGECPEVIATNPMRRAGHGPAERENDSGIASGGNVLVIARSGNQGWDEDVYDAVGGVEDESAPDIPCLGEDRSGPDPGMTIAKLALPVLIGAAIYFLFIDKNRIK
jgi:hypothetical protein